MMGTSAVRTGAVFGCLLWLTWGSLVYSMFGPPCMSQLGLKHDRSSYSLTFELAVSDGEADQVRLNGPKAWTPQNMIGSFLEVNVSDPILLTALQVQGDPLTSGRVTGWFLDTSLDCENYRTENYSMDFVSILQTETVLVKNIEFVSCIRLRPIQYNGETPALRLELLGCAINDNTKCGRDVYPTVEMWMDDGGRQLDFGQEVVLDLVKVLLELKIHQDTLVQIFYSRTCEVWKKYDPLDMNTISVTSSDQVSRWLTVELEVPIRTRCLRISPPLSTTVREVHASGCSSYLASSLRELEPEIDLNPTENDAKTVAEALSHAETSKTSVPNVLPQESVVTPTTVTHINGITNRLNSNVPTGANLSLDSNENTKPSLNYSEIKTVSPNYSEITNSSVFMNESLLDITYPKEINGSSWITTVANGSTDMKDVKEEHTTTYNTSMKDVGVKISTNDSSTTKSTSLNITDTKVYSSQNTVTDGVDTSSTSKVSRDLVHGPNSTLTTLSVDVNTLPTNESMQEDVQFKDYNETVCGIKNSAKGIRRKRVISGTMNTPGEWPWLVSMHYLIEFDFTRESGFKHTCGASLIAPAWIITAAHCFSDDLLVGLSNLSCWRVYFGMHDLARADSNHFVQERLIDAIYPYPRYDITDDQLLYDLVLVRLNESVEINERVSPVCLDNDTDLHENEGQCYVSGWGKVSLTTPGSRYPHTAALSTMTLSNCKGMYDMLPDDNVIKKYVHIEPPILCAAVGDNGEDACQGDSGGPLMCERDGYWYQAGIVAAGFQCGHKATPGLYTRISYYSDWIRNTMELIDG